MVIVAFGLALAAVIMTNLYIGFQQSGNLNTFEVYTLTRSVESGDKFKNNDWQPLILPAKLKPHFEALGAMSRSDITSWVNKERFERPARRGAPLTHNMFIADGSRLLDVMVQPGTRHMDLPVNWRLVPAGVRPGVRIDLEANLDTGRGIPEVILIMESVKVVGVNRLTLESEQLTHASRRDGLRGSIKKITIQVKPEQSSTLSLIEKIAIGDFELRLRNPDDQTRRLDVPPGAINPEVLDLLNQLREQPATARRYRR